MRMINVFNARNQDTLHDTVLTSGAMIAKNTDIVMDCPNTILPLAQYYQTHRNGHTRSSSRHCQGDQERRDNVIMTCTEAAPDDNKGTGRDAIGSAQGNPIQHTKATAAEPTVTHHNGYTAQNPCTAAHQVTTLRTAVGHIHVHPTDHQNMVHTTGDQAFQDHTPSTGPKKSHLNRNRKVHIEEPHSNFYSLDDSSSD